MRSSSSLTLPSAPSETASFLEEDEHNENETSKAAIYSTEDLKKKKKKKKKSVDLSHGTQSRNSSS